MQLSDLGLGITPDGTTQRGLLVGTTQSGKSTLAGVLLAQWRRAYTDSVTLFVDTKPRFMATKELSGLSARGRYKHWRAGAHVPHSIALPPGYLSRQDLEQAIDLARQDTPPNQGVALILQTDDRSMYDHFNELITWFYKGATKRYWRMVYMDEMRAFMAGSRSLQSGAVTIITSGAERGVGFLGATQRPRWIPAEALTEMSKLYLFKTDYSEDIQHLRQMGIGQSFRAPQERHTFHYFDKTSGADSWLRLPAALAKHA